MDKVYMVRVLEAWEVISKEEAEERDFQGVIINDPSKLEMFRITEASVLIKATIKMGLPRTDYYGKYVHYQIPGDFALRSVRIVALNPRGRIYKVMGRNENGTDVKMPIKVLEQLN